MKGGGFGAPASYRANIRKRSHRCPNPYWDPLCSRSRRNSQGRRSFAVNFDVASVGGLDLLVWRGTPATGHAFFNATSVSQPTDRHVFQAFGHCHRRCSDGGGHVWAQSSTVKKTHPATWCKTPRRGAPAREPPNMRLVTSSATKRNQHLSLRRLTELPRPPLVCARVKHLWPIHKRRDPGARRVRVSWPDGWGVGAEALHPAPFQCRQPDCVSALAKPQFHRRYCWSPGDEGEVEKGRSGIAVAPLCFIIISGVPHVPLDTPGEC